MHATDISEFIQAIDTYEEVLGSFPQIVPKKESFIISQVEIDLTGALDELRDNLPSSALADINRGRVTLRRREKEKPIIDYRVTLVDLSGNIGFPRVTSTTFERTGGTVDSTSYWYNAQYGETEYKEAHRLQKLHVALAIVALNSDNARQRIETTYNALLDLEEKSKDQKISEFKKKEIEKSIGHCILK
jgi:hypothetical protein